MPAPPHNPGTYGGKRDRPRPRRCEGGVMGRKLSLEQKWREQAEALKHEADKLPYGKEREELLRMSRQLETASHINEWVSSPALSPPTQGNGRLPILYCRARPP